MADGSVTIEVKLTKEQLEKGLKEIESSINATVNNSKRTLEDIGKSFQTIGKEITGVGTSMSKYLTAPIVALGTLGITYNSQLEQSERALTTLTGSAEEASKIMEQIKKDAMKTPFDVRGLTKAEQLLISTGISAKESRDVILALGDAVASTGGGNDELSRMAVNLQQIKNVGKASALDIKQFAYAGIDIYGLLADYTGKTREEVAELDVTYEDLSNALKNASKEGGKYFGAMEQQSKTTAGKISNLKDTFNEFAGDLTKEFVPVVKDIIDGLNNWLQKFKNLDSKTKKLITTTALFLATAGPVLIFTGKLITSIGTIIKVLGTLKTAFTVVSGVIGGFATAGLSIIGVFLAIDMAVENSKRAMVENVRAMGEGIAQGMNDFRQGIESSVSVLDTFNDSMFISPEEQTELAKNMQKTQDNINTIVRNAVEERRGLTNQEKEDLKKYFDDLEKLIHQELEIEQARADAIEVMAQQESDAHKGSLEDYEQTAQKWIKTATEQRDKTVKLAEDRYTEELTMATRAYKQTGEIDQAEYNRRVQQATQNKQLAIDTANQEVGSVYSIYAEGYAQRINNDESFLGHMKYWRNEMEKEEQRHSKELESIQNNRALNSDLKLTASQDENKRYTENMKRLWSNLSSGMNDEKNHQLGTLLELANGTSVYGNKLQTTTSYEFNEIMKTWNKMPSEYRNVFSQAMQGGINGLQSKEPALYSKAKGIAGSVTNIMSKMFKIGSPSKVMKEMFGYVIEGAEIGMEQEKTNLFRETEKIAQGVLDRFSFESLSNKLQNAVDLENNKMSANLNNSMSRNFTAQISLDGTVEMDKKKVGRIVTPSVQRTFREGGAYVN